MSSRWHSPYNLYKSAPYRIIKKSFGFKFDSLVAMPTVSQLYKHSITHFSKTRRFPGGLYFVPLLNFCPFEFYGSSLKFFYLAPRN